MKKIIVTKNIDVRKINFDEGSEVIKFEDLIAIFRRMSLRKLAFQYDEAVLFSYKNNLISKPFLTALILKFLSPFKSIFKDISGNNEIVDYKKIIKLLARFIKNLIYSGEFVCSVEKDLKTIILNYSKRELNGMNQCGHPIYLRTDISFNVISGGSVGHIAGVINNFKYFTGEPIFITSDKISTVTDDILTYVVYPGKEYADFTELWPMYYNRVFEKAVNKITIDFPISFVYQRYSLYNYCGLKLAYQYNVPFVLEYNGSEIWINRNWGKPLNKEKLANEIEMANLKHSDLIVVVSQVMKDELITRGVEENKILVNPNGVEPDIYSPEIDGTEVRRKYDFGSKIVIGFIGTFGKWHGAELLVEAYGRLLKASPKYFQATVLLMVGDGVTMPKVKEVIEKYQISNNCVLTGLVSQPEGPKYLAACDILVSPHVPNSDGTPFFGSPTKLFEYMAMGKGIVASDLEQIGEILRHGETAYMVKPGDVDALHAGMKILISDAVLRTRLGENARAEAVAKYTWREHTRKIVERLNEIIMK